ncbi:MAG: 50S ribosomal protein L31 [Candidatus Eremiobacteraeota bacterium]|nr:50S ribosomal protein L31 [Candidatus Eremiobacteraeota bacterium]
MVSCPNLTVWAESVRWRAAQPSAGAERAHARCTCTGCYNAKAVKSKIHPKWYPQARVHCACGNSFVTGSTLPEIAVEICAACHPLFTGQQKLVDTAGRVDKFNQRTAAARRKQEEAAARKAAREARKAAAEV